MPLNLRFQIERSGARPASGQHLELLNELKSATESLSRFVEAEADGTYDGYEHDGWIGSDPIIETAKKLLNLAEQRGSVRDAARR
jgi:hypothetical protein